MAIDRAPKSTTALAALNGTIGLFLGIGHCTGKAGDLGDYGPLITLTLRSAEPGASCLLEQTRAVQRSSSSIRPKSYSSAYPPHSVPLRDVRNLEGCGPAAECS